MEPDILSSVKDKALVKQVVTWLECELSLLSLHSSHASIAASHGGQKVISKIAAAQESNSEAKLLRTHNIQHSVEQLWGRIAAFDNSDRDATREAEEMRNWKLRINFSRKKLAAFGQNAYREVEAKEKQVENAYAHIKAHCLSHQQSMDMLDYVGGDLWSETEERRLRCGLLYFGRDWDRVAEYVRLRRVERPAHTKKGNPRLKAKMQKFLVTYQKLALPLPLSMRCYGENYTLLGHEPLDKSSQLWRKIAVDTQHMLPIEHVPFGRRRHIFAKDPVYYEIDE